MYDDVHVGYKLEILSLDHDPMFTVASMFKQMQDLCVSFPVYTRIKNIKNVTRCRDSRSAKSIETR